MSRIDQAQERLERAVARLERARRAQTDRLSQMKDARSAGPDAAEMNNLVRALDEAQRENAALVAERESMADRVDTIIGRLKTVAGLDMASMTDDDARSGGRSDAS